MRPPLLLCIAAFTAGVLGVTTAAGQPPAGDAKKLAPELAAVQGEWTIAKIDMPEGLSLPDHVKSSWVTVRGDRVTLFSPWKGKVVEAQHGLLAVDATKTPRQMDVIPTTEKFVRIEQRLFVPDGKGGEKLVNAGPVPPYPTIYKLEAGKLVVCFPFTIRDDEQKLTRPTAFRVIRPEAREAPYTALLHLEKKK